MKKFLAIILTFVLCFGVLSVALAAEDEPVAAVPDGYIGIYTAEDLDNIRNGLSGKYILMNNIDLSSHENWSPIGTSETPFSGELNGNGYVIKNMKIHKEFTDGEEPCLGLFSSINSAEIINLLLLGVDIKASFAGEAPGSFGIGSISGYAKGATFESCITSGAITIDGFNEGFAGGISGTGISSELTNCVNNTKINLLSENVYDICIGGIFGRGTRTTISHSVNSGDIAVRGIDYDKKGRMLKIGGLAADFGNFHLVLNDCYNKGNISLDFSIPSAYVGGIMGNGFLIKQCYNAGKITVPETFSGYAGGISGNFPEGWLASFPSPNIINSYYNNKDFYPTYIGEESSPSDDYFTNVKYLTPEEMKNQESFVGFDFDTVWEMEENGYPILRNMPVIPETEKPGETKPTTTTELATEEITTLPIATPAEPSTTEPTTEENTTVPVATPIEPSTTETATSEVVTTENTTEPVTNPVTEPSTAEVTTQPVTVTTQPATESTTIPATEPSTTQPVTETESATKPVTDSPATPVEPSTEATTEPVSEPDDDIGVLAWLIKIIKMIFAWFVKLFVMLGC